MVGLGGVMAGKRWVVVEAAVLVRAGFEMKSKPVGQLKKGEELTSYVVSPIQITATLPDKSLPAPRQIAAAGC